MRLLSHVQTLCKLLLPLVAMPIAALLSPDLARAAIQLKPEHPANRLNRLKVVEFAHDTLRLKAEGLTTGLLVLWSDQPVVIEKATGAEAKLIPGWDGSIGYSHYGLEVNVPAAGEIVVQLHSIPPPKAPIPTTEADLAQFETRFRSRPSRFPDDPAEFAKWQRVYRQKLAAWLMGGGLPERVPLDARVTDTKDHLLFTLRRVEYRTRPDRTNTLLLSLPKGLSKAPLLLALHGHESAWGQADPKAYELGHADDFIAYFARRGWAVLQPATMDHTLQHPNRTLQGQWTWDAMVALDYAATVPEVDMSRVAVCGLSSGGHLAMSVLALDDRVTSGVVGCILSTWNHFERHFRVPPGCDCGISLQLGGRLEECDWAALAAPKRVQFQHGRKDAAFCPGADPKLLDFKWNTGVMPQAEYDTIFAEVQRAYSLAGKPHAVETSMHNGPHKVDNASAFRWLNP